MLTFAARELGARAARARCAPDRPQRILICRLRRARTAGRRQIIEHRELGYRSSLVDDKAAGDHLGYRGLPLLRTIEEGGRYRDARRPSTTCTWRCARATRAMLQLSRAPAASAST